MGNRTPNHPDRVLALDGIVVSDEGVTVTWMDAQHSFFHNIWLRDNCRCRECGEPSIGRGSLTLTRIPPDIGVASVKVEESKALVIRWSDGHRTELSSNWLRTHRYDDKARRQQSFLPMLWDKHLLKAPPSMSYAAANDGGERFMAMLCKVRDFGIYFLTDAPVLPGTLELLATQIGPPQESNFGRLQDIAIDSSKRSIANAIDALKVHTDEPYRASPPGILLFHCLETDVSGAGASTFLDGFEIAKVLRREDPEGFAALVRNRQAFRRHFPGDVDLITEFPLITLDEFGNMAGIRLNDRVAAPLSIPPDQVTDYYRGLRRLLALSEDPERTIERTLRPGDMAIFDNHRVLHGRTRLTLNGRRRLQWLQVERGDFHSTLRITADRLNLDRDAAPLLRGAYG